MKEDKELQARDRLLNLYLDGEMTSEKSADYRSEVLAKDAQTLQDHQDLLAVKREIRTYVKAQSDQALSHVDSQRLWDRIDAEISREQDVPLPWWSKLSIPSFAFASAFALLAFVLGMQFGAKPFSFDLSTKSKNQTLAKNINEKKQNDNFQFELKPNNHEILVAANSDGMLHRMPIELDSNQLIGVSHNYPLRAQGADIDWIKSDHDYKLVSSGKSVPVIWVSGSK